MLYKQFAGILIAAGLLPFVKSTLSAGGDRKNKPDVGSNKQFIFVSTVDGKLSALDLKQSGKLLWSLNLNEGPLISSSITKLVYEQDGKTVRLVPSLSGGLFKFDGETVEAVPFDADHLLQSSFRLAENTVLIGGKETCFTGIDVSLGKVLYSCNVKGCDQQQNVPDANDVIVVKRFRQIVRSIENRNGAENWNFSVSEIDIQFSKGSATHLLQTSGEKASKTSNQDTFGLHDDVEDLFDISDLSRIKFVVPDGTICMVKPKNQQLVAWKHKFSSAISSAWILSDNRLKKLDMFDSSKVPALGKDGKSPPSSDVIYMGTYEKQVYIQASPSVQQVVSQAVSNNFQHVGHVTYNPPRFKHRPCQTKSKYLTLAGPEKVSKSSKTTSLVVADRGAVEDDVNKLLFCHEDSHSSKGYYFQGDLSYYSRIQQTSRKGRNTIISESNGSKHQESYGYFHQLSPFLDKYVLITILSLMLIPLLLHHGPQWLRKYSHHSDAKLPSHYDSADEAKEPTPSPTREYESRFLQDFEPQECLGRGGFGIVFKAKNKMDDCSYAVKRILLPHKASDREKVLREVRALAKLDHPSIVRYFNSWSEKPPAGWQKKQDEVLVKDLSVWSSLPRNTKVNKSTPPSSSSSSQIEHGKSSESCTQGFELISEKSSITNLPTPGFSQGFSFHANHTNTEDHTDDNFDQTNSSWAETTQSLQHQVADHLKGKFFQSHSTGSESSNNSSMIKNESLPFQNYQDQSMSIVFGHHSEKNDEQLKESGKDSGTHGLSTPDSRSSLSTTSDKVHHSNLEVVVSEPPHDTVYLYIQMQLCQKQSLKEWLAGNRHREKSVYTDIFCQVVDAVKYVHDQGLIHRDLKPSNVLFSLDGTIKVGDFGLVTHTGELCSEECSFYEDNTNKQHTKQAGTTLYMAPEQMSSGHYTEKVDIFALGLILFELVYTFETQMEKVRYFSDARKLKFPKNFFVSFAQEAALIDSMLQREPDSRPSASSIRGDQMFT